MARFTIIYAPEVLGHLSFIDLKFHRLIQEAIKQQLQHTPLAQTKNKKPLDQPAPFGATWEIRFGPDNRFRVFYEVDQDQHYVHVLAVGVKAKNCLRVGGEEIEL
jgi:hypothetical protein